MCCPLSLCKLHIIIFNLGKNSLSYAANTDVVKILLDHGADIGAKDNNGIVVIYPPNHLFIYNTK